MGILGIGACLVTVIWAVNSYRNGGLLDPHVEDEELNDPDLYRKKYIDPETGEDRSKKSAYRTYIKNKNKDRNKDGDEDRNKDKR